MTPPIPAFILLPDGTMPRGITDLAHMTALSGGTLDVWAYKKHRRAYGARFIHTDDKLSLVLERVMRRNGKIWEQDRLASLNHFLVSGQGYCIPTHTATSLICYTAAHKTPAGEPVQFALYPPTYPVGPGVHQVTGWLNAISPAWGTPDW